MARGGALTVDAIAEEAPCSGWNDNLPRTLDDEREDDAATPKVEPVRACASSLCIESCRTLCVVGGDCASGTCDVLAIGDAYLGVCALP